MGVSGTPCEQRGGLDPSPYPLPWTWTGGAASGQSAQDGPRWLQEGLGEPKMTSKMAQDSPRCLKMASKMLQEAPRPLQDGSKWPRSLPKEAPKRPISFNNQKKPNVFCLLAFSLSMAFRGLKMSPRGHQRAQDDL